MYITYIYTYIHIKHTHTHTKYKAQKKKSIDSGTEVAFPKKKAMGFQKKSGGEGGEKTHLRP